MKRTMAEGDAARRVYGVVGFKNSGKTTLVERLVREITGRGLTVSTLKHAHHVFDVDHPGKDSWRHREAGATEVLVASRKRWALMHELRAAEEPELETLLEKLAPVDLVLIEGYKRGPHPKVEAYRLETGHPILALEDPRVRAVAADAPEDPRFAEVAQPRFPLDDAAAIATFILADAGLT